MSIKIHSRWDKKVLYVAKNATDVRQALQEAVKARADLRSADLTGAYLRSANLTGANLSGADLRSADLRSADLTGAYLRSADLRSADLTGADLRSAYLRSANLRSANLRSADLRSADLTGAYLRSANLTGANLTGAKGVESWRCNDLLILAAQPGRVRAYKLVNEKGEGPNYGGIKYEQGETYEVPGANTDEMQDCGAGINLATLPWCVRFWRAGFRILIAEFTAKDIAAIPISDGKFRVKKAKIVGEVDLVELGLVEKVEAVA